MRTQLAAGHRRGSQHSISPDCVLEAPRREARLGAAELSGPLAAQAAGGSSSLDGHSPMAPSPGTGGHWGQKSDRGVSPDDHPETGANSEQRAAERIDLIWSCVGIVLVLACVLFDAPFWLGQLLIAWGWV